MIRICGIDPGKTTGIAIINWDGSRSPEPQRGDMFAEVAFEVMPQTIEELAKIADLFVVERFTISGRTLTATRQYEALYTIGGVVFAAARYEIPVRMQMASDAKSAYSNDRLKELGWRTPGRHARDALRHALLATHSSRLYSEVTDPDR